MDCLAVFIDVGELSVAEDEGVIFLFRVANSMESGDGINEFVDLGEVDLDDGEAGWSFPEVLEVAVDFIDDSS